MVEDMLDVFRAVHGPFLDLLVGYTFFSMGTLTMLPHSVHEPS